MNRRFPMSSYPTGWFQVATSRELRATDVRPLRYFGRDLVLYRGEDGTARVLDAHCAHLGAHLGHGGCVVGGGVRCPFHGWLYGADGQCREVPGSGNVPPGARVKPWRVHESDGLIFVFHSETPTDVPDWEVPRIAEHGSPEWTEYDEHRFPIRTHVQEIAENIVDPAHFRVVHGTLTMPETKAELDGPVLHARSVTRMQTPRGEVAAEIDARAYGLGLWVLRFTGIVETVLVNTNTPIDAETVDTRMSFMVRRTGGASNTHGVGKGLIADVVRQVKEDVVIWEHKVYRGEPVYGAFDRNVVLLRKWSQQFYRTATPSPACGGG